MVLFEWNLRESVQSVKQKLGMNCSAKLSPPEKLRKENFLLCLTREA
jgi:hypothetical protein